MRILHLAIPTLFAVACSGAAVTIDGDENADSGAAGDAAARTDGGGADGRAGLGDAGSAADGLVALDAGSGDVTTTPLVAVRFDVTDLFQDCMPPVVTDPVQMRGKITITNNTQATVGAISITKGAFFLTNGSEAATYTVEPVS